MVVLYSSTVIKYSIEVLYLSVSFTALYFIPPLFFTELFHYYLNLISLVTVYFADRMLLKEKFCFFRLGKICHYPALVLLEDFEVFWPQIILDLQRNSIAEFS